MILTEKLKNNFTYESCLPQWHCLVNAELKGGCMEILFDTGALNRLSRGINSQDYVSEEELFTDDFLSTCTRYHNLHELIEAFLTIKLPYVFNDFFREERTLNRILDFFDSTDIWDEFVAYNTIFEDWNSFYCAAVELFNAKTFCIDAVQKFSGLKYKPSAMHCGFTVKHEFEPQIDPEEDDYY
jgi:hypothetical protein